MVAAKRPASKPAAKQTAAKPAAKRAVAKPAAKRPAAKSVAKPAAKRPAAKPAAKRPVAKPATKRPVAKPAAKRPAAKPAAKRPATKPAAKSAAKRLAAKPAAKRAPALAMFEDASAPLDEIDPIDTTRMPIAEPRLGPSRIVWVFRVDGPIPMAIGKLYVVREADSPLHLLKPRRRLVPGRYELMFARYGHRWPVTLTSAEDGHPDDMLVLGRIPL